MAQAKKLSGPVCKVTVPFSQLANFSVLVGALDLKTGQIGGKPGKMIWIVTADNVEWPGEYLKYFKGTGITLEDLHENDPFKNGLPSGWNEGQL